MTCESPFVDEDRVHKVSARGCEDILGSDVGVDAEWLFHALISAEYSWSQLVWNLDFLGLKHFIKFYTCHVAHEQWE